tara:strand:- start:5507 stop:7213 length:1707 start_codon:yes stop_codon:yes gene_type:complete
MQLLQHFKELTVRPTNAQELKGLIMQLAVQGKLTGDWRTNNPNVNKASINLESIKAKKELQIVQESEIPFKLNSTWEWAKFIDVAELRHGHQFRKYDFVEEGIPVIKIGQCKSDGTLDFTKCNYIDSNRKDEFQDDLIFQGHLLMALTGGTLGKVTRVDKDYGILVQNYRVGNFFADERVISLDFLNVILESELFQGLVRERINQNAQPNIGKDNIEKIVMPIPPLEEQKAIVEVVETLFKEVEQLEQLTVERISLKEDFVTSALNQLTTNNAKQEWTFLQDHFKTFFNETTNIKKLRETILQLAVQGKLTADWRANNPNIEDASILLKRIQKEKAQLIKDKKIKKEKPFPPITTDEIPYELPESWVWCRLGTVSQIGSSKRIYEADYVKQGVPFYRSKEIGDFSRGNKAKSKLFISNQKYLEISKKFGAPKQGDLLITSVGSIGNTWVADDREFYYKDGNITQINRSDYVDTFYTQLFIKSPTFMDEVLGKVSGTAYSALTIIKLKSLMFMLPPLEEQKAIVQKVNALMGLCDALEQEVLQSQEHSEQLMQSCLREVFEGEHKTVEV